MLRNIKKSGSWRKYPPRQVVSESLGLHKYFMQKVQSFYHVPGTMLGSVHVIQVKPLAWNQVWETYKKIVIIQSAALGIAHTILEHKPNY